MKLFESDKGYPHLMIADNDGAHELRFYNAMEWKRPLENLSLIQQCSGVFEIRATPREGTTPKKVFIYSSAGEKQIITASLGYTFDGPVKVQAWKSGLRWLLSTVDFEHVGASKSPLSRHLERIHGLPLVDNEGPELAQRAYLDMLWNVPKYA